MREQWIVQQKKTDFKKWAEEYGVSSLMIRLMFNRGVSPEDMGRYLNPSLSDLYNPELIYGGDAAVELLIHAIDAGQGIVIASDFDCDGIFSSTILSRALSKLGAKVWIKTPNRVEEGYGLNRRIVDEACELGAGLLITCDNGIAASDEIDYAKERGLIVVVTDHHDVPYDVILNDSGEEIKEERLPSADAIVNPKQIRCQYPYKELCGAGVAYKVMCLLYQKLGHAESELYFLLPYAAIATVADVMPLTGENRILVMEGLKRLQRTEDPGLSAIIAACGLQEVDLKAYHIGFVIGPCFNASGRLRTVDMALELLQSESYEKALSMAEKLKQLNDERKQLTEQGFQEAKLMIQKQNLEEDKVILLTLSCHESLAGIIAGRIREMYQRPTFVFTQHDGMLKGSGRSIAAYSMFERLQECNDLLERYGGHPMAAGLTLKEENLERLRERLIQKSGLTEKDFCEVIRIDADMPVSYITEPLLEEMTKLEPCGRENPKPLFVEAHFHIHQAKRLGDGNRVLRMSVTNAKDYPMEAIYFGDVDAFLAYVTEQYGEKACEDMLAGRKNPVDMGFTYYPDINEYKGQRNIQIVIHNYCRIAGRS